KAGDINDGIGDAIADIGIVHDGDDAGAAALALGNQINHACGTDGVQRGGWLVEQQNWQIRQEAARDIHALLFAAREPRRRKRQQSLRDIKPAEQVARMLARLLSSQAVRDERLRDHIEGWHTRNSPQELADIANGAPSQAEDLPW